MQNYICIYIFFIHLKSIDNKLSWQTGNTTMIWSAAFRKVGVSQLFGTPLNLSNRTALWYRGV